MLDVSPSRIVGLVLVATFAASGCSWMMVRQAPADYTAQTADAPPDCTASLGPAIGDTWDTIAIGGGLTALGIISLTTSAESLFVFEDPTLGVSQIAGGVGLGAMFGASAHHGYTSTRRCRRLRDQFQGALYEKLDSHSHE